MRGRRLLAAVGALAGAALVLAGCNVGARVQITMHDDGSGTVATTVTLDADAVARLGGAAALASAVRVDDLRAAGWAVSGWRAGASGSRSITLSHPFTDAADLTVRVGQLAGPHGVLQQPALVRDRGWFSSRDALSVVVDVRAPAVDLVHDPALASRLRAVHLDPAQLQSQLASQLRNALHVSVVLAVPGRAAQSFDVPAGTVQTVRTEHRSTNWDAVVKVGIALALGLIAVLFLVAAGVGARRSRRRAAQRRRAEPVATADRAPLM